MTFRAIDSEVCAEINTPNIISILADYLGWSDVGYNSPKSYKKPHSDRLAPTGDET
jgi:hypothetical protein